MMKITDSDITGLEEVVASLPAEDKKLWQRIYRVSATTGEMCIPQGMQPWVRQQFGSVAAVTRQKIVKVTNTLTHEESLFNRLRSSRPIEVKEDKSLADRLAEAARNDLFHSPQQTTPQDIFGRVVGKHCITASNVAKYAGLHGIVIFNELNPLRFSREQVVDYLDVAWQWAKKAQAEQPQAKYFFCCWNCLWRAGASVYHGHAQVMLTTGRHYAKIEGLRQVAENYRRDYGASYFSDLCRLHHSLGCAVEKEGVSVLAHLTPYKDNEVVLIAGSLNLSLQERVYEVLACLRDRLGVTSFNLGLVTPPLAATEENWADFPVIARVVDRGDSGSQASDIGGIEIYASSVVSSDPFALARQLRQCLG